MIYVCRLPGRLHKPDWSDAACKTTLLLAPMQDQTTMNIPKSSTGDVTVITVTYNSAKVIGGALKSIMEHPRVSDCLVIDNASTDDTCRIVREHFPAVRLVENTENVGFGVANNLALEQCTTEYALLLNPDAEMETDTLDTLLSIAKANPDAAIIAPTLVGDDGEHHDSHRHAVLEQKKRLSSRPKITRQTQAVDFVIAAVWLLNMNLLRPIGFFDPRLFLFYEDDDLCQRVRDAGSRILYTTTTQARHIWGGSSTGEDDISAFKEFHMALSRCHIEGKYRGRPAAVRFASRLRTKYRFKIWLYRLLGKSVKVDRYRARLEGVDRFRLDLEQGAGGSRASTG